MKIIDLLNKIANDEEVPRKFKYENTTFFYSDNVGEYFDEEEYNSFNYTFDLGDYDVLNDEIEIIEEDKKIKKLKANDFGNNENFEEVDSDIDYIVEKINEIIDKLNKEE